MENFTQFNLNVLQKNIVTKNRTKKKLSKICNEFRFRKKKKNSKPKRKKHIAVWKFHFLSKNVYIFFSWIFLVTSVLFQLNNKTSVLANIVAINIYETVFVFKKILETILSVHTYRE